MIPEAVFSVTSVSTNSTAHFETPIGIFYYYFISGDRYDIGIDQQQNSCGGFQIATPEKALADLVHFKSQGLNVDELLVDLIEFRRIDESDLEKLNKNHMRNIADKYDSEPVTKLVMVLDKYF